MELQGLLMVAKTLDDGFGDNVQAGAVPFCFCNSMAALAHLYGSWKYGLICLGQLSILIYGEHSSLTIYRILRLDAVIPLIQNASSWWYRGMFPRQPCARPER
jgi:hypothetical protein